MNHLTTQELEAIRKRAEQATEGPWSINGKDYPNDKTAKLVTNKHVYIAKSFNGESDADFIANARTDIPKLLAEVDRLNDKVAYYLDEMERRQKLYDDLARKQAINGGD